MIPPTKNRQAGAPALLYIGPDEAFERVKRLGDDLRHLKERWDNRLVFEDSPPVGKLFRRTRGNCRLW